MIPIGLPNIAAPSNWDAGSLADKFDVTRPLSSIWDGEKYIGRYRSPSRNTLESSFIFRDITTVTHVYIDAVAGGTDEYPYGVQVIAPFAQDFSSIPELNDTYFSHYADNGEEVWLSLAPGLGLKRNDPPVPTINLGTWVDLEAGVTRLRRVSEIVFPRPTAIGGFTLVDEGVYSGGTSVAIFGIYVRASVKPAFWREYLLTAEV